MERQKAPPPTMDCSTLRTAVMANQSRAPIQVRIHQLSTYQKAHCAGMKPSSTLSTFTRLLLK